MQLPVSVYIIAHNEADRIGAAIASVAGWVDEIVVVDSFSTDGTPQIAAHAGARVVQRAWMGFGPQRRLGEKICRNDWILSLDADERVTPRLKQEILALFAGGTPALKAYGMPVLMVYPGKRKPRPFARDHWCVRLYDRRAVGVRESQIHDAVETGSHKVGTLACPLEHYSMRSFHHMIRKLDERTWLAVREREHLSTAELWLRLPIEFLSNFTKYYLVRRHCTGGLNGLVYATIQATFRHLRIYRMVRAQSELPALPEPLQQKSRLLHIIVPSARDASEFPIHAWHGHRVSGHWSDAYPARLAPPRD
jgi:glycosyltransferase involved in cell wall biosynthesis